MPCGGLSGQNGQMVEAAAAAEIGLGRWHPLLAVPSCPFRQGQPCSQFGTVTLVPTQAGSSCLVTPSITSLSAFNFAT